MIHYFASFILFCVVLFVYLHIQFYLKTSNDLELYEVDMCSKEKMDEMCDMRQPIIINHFDGCDTLIRETNIVHLKEQYPDFEMMVRDVGKEENIDNSQLRVPLKLNALCSLFNAENESDFITENNLDFLTETSVIKRMRSGDQLMRPAMVMSSMYDILAGNNGAITPLKYSLNCRNFFLVTHGTVTIKLFPPRSAKYLHPIKDYVNFEHRSPVNPWAPQSKYASDYSKIKSLELKAVEGQMLYIPAYWWYSIQFSSNGSVSSFCYRTYMNTLSILPELAMEVLQNQNITHQTAADTLEDLKPHINHPQVQNFNIQV